MEEFTHRSRTIRIETEEAGRTFSESSEIPVELRRKLQKALSGPRAFTILIANEGGRRQIVKALEGEATALRSNLIQALVKQNQEVQTKRFLGLLGKEWAEVILVGIIGGCLWLVATWK